jgi:hypothetical protein
MASTISKANAYDLTAQAIANHSFNKTSGDDYRSGLSTSQSEAFSKINEAGENFAKQNNISKESAIKILAGVSVSGSKSFSAGKGSSSLMNTVASALGLNGSLDISGSTSKTDLISKAQNFAEKSDLKNAFDVASSAAFNKSFAMSDSKGNVLNDNISSSLSEANRLEESSRLNYQRADSLSSSASNVETNSVNNRANEQQLFKNWLTKQNYGGRPLGELGARDLLNSSTRQKQAAVKSFAKKYAKENLSPGVLNPDLPALGSNIYDSPQNRALESQYQNNSQLMRKNNQQMENNHNLNKDSIITNHDESLEKKIDHADLEQQVTNTIINSQGATHQESLKPQTLKDEAAKEIDKGRFGSTTDDFLKSDEPMSLKESFAQQDSKGVNISNLLTSDRLENQGPSPMMQNSAINLGGYKEDFSYGGQNGQQVPVPQTNNQGSVADKVSSDLAQIFSNKEQIKREPELKIDVKKPKGNKGR